MPLTQVEDLDGRLALDWAEATIHVLSHALHYGTAYSRASCYAPRGGRPCGTWTTHCPSLSLFEVYTGVVLRRCVAEGIKDVIRANGLRSCYIRARERGTRDGVNPPTLLHGHHRRVSLVATWERMR